MWYRTGADIVLLLHLCFIVFVIAGGFLLLKWRGLVWVHLPAVAWGALVEFSGWVCPLTPLEQHLRSLAGESSAEADFIGRYLPPLLYPAALTREIQLLLGMVVLLVNLAFYWRVFFRPSGESA
ncbi:MAG TPA: DUF2784 domain-containing protein [Nitrospira sp.]|nr:DUF2784 domain-containing protein [Nitrospira sp. NTP1]HQR16413.1 DUF2784 domain-containing protein [Nitrospira sp.]HQV12566.1 DUF2784 domain-containing protein [Nitrospira sp.]